MKKIVYPLIICVVLLWAACDPPTFQIEHPIEVKTMDTIFIPFTFERFWPGENYLELLNELPDSGLLKKKIVEYTQTSNRLHDSLWFGIKMPENWTVIDSFPFVAYDSLPASIIDSGLFVYSLKHVQEMNNTRPPGPGYKWMAWTSDALAMDRGKLWSGIQLITDDTCGYIYLKYVSGYNPMILTQVSDSMLTACGAMNETSRVYTTADDGPGSLRYAIYNTKARGQISMDIDAGDTIKLNSSLLIRKPLVLNGAIDDSLRANIQGPDSSHCIVAQNIPGGGVTDFLVVSNANIFGAGRDGIHNTGSQIRIMRSKIYDNQGAGIYAGPGGGFLYLYSCEIHNNQNSGVRFSQRGSESTISSCYIHDNIAEEGGGIYISSEESTEVRMEDCLIENNSALYGGGIYSNGDNVNILLLSTKVRKNSAQEGGGIYSRHAHIGAGYAQTNMSDIYLNQAITGKDIYWWNDHHLNIYIDTFTVLYPTPIYIYAINEEGIPQSFDYEIFHGILDQFSHDFYVSPEGHDENDGSSWENAKQTINSALEACLPDHPMSIYLDSGQYAQGFYEERFPIVLFGKVKLQGMGAEKSILGPAPEVLLLWNGEKAEIRDLGIKTSKTGINCYADRLILENVNMLKDSSGNARGIDAKNKAINIKHSQFKGLHIGIHYASSVNIHNSEFRDCAHAIYYDAYNLEKPKMSFVSNSLFSNNEWVFSDCGRLTGENLEIVNNGNVGRMRDYFKLINSKISGNTKGIEFQGDSLILDNCSITGNGTGAQYTDFAGGINWYCQPESPFQKIYLRLLNSRFENNTGEYAGAFSFRYFHPHANHDITITDHLIRNCIFEGNKVTNQSFGSGSALYVRPDNDDQECTLEMNIVNSQFTDNDWARAVIWTESKCPLNFINSTLANNSSRYGIVNAYNDTIKVINSIVRHGEPGPFFFQELPPFIAYSNIQDTLTGPGVIDTLPLFDSLGIFPYQLLAGSACIGSGSMDTNGFNLPDLDLAGNPRITDGSIDMGAYECLYTGISRPKTEVFHLEVLPNPMQESLLCRFRLREGKKVSLEIFDQHSHLVYQLQEHCFASGKNQLRIDLKNLSSGIYYLRLLTDEEVISRKIIKL
ncbi:MAG: right-handed parallel beta-helix repeat-containing protein [Bacteroidales bacterium]|nr:right-handed parallel beta-helix repeat-containing protein [Bacteroidales bacterium]MCF8396675.1 right-handed parallel beta-helix repeat-containing protein [Bacteroidales bacterium]